MNRTSQSHKPKVLLDRDIQNPRFDAGTLFEVLADDPYESKVKVQSLDPGDSGVILCNREILREVTSLEALVLLPVKPVRNRLKIYRDQEWLKEIPVISENKRVVVKDKFEGIVKFKGVVREYGPGIRFIVEIQNAQAPAPPTSVPVSHVHGSWTRESRPCLDEGSVEGNAIPATRNVYFGDNEESATDMLESTAPSVSPRRSAYRETARKRAESVVCPSMFRQPINMVEALRVRQEHAERLIRLAERRPFSANLPLPPATVNSGASPTTPHAAPDAVSSVGTFPASQESPDLTDGCSQLSGPASVPLPQEFDTEVEIVDTSTSRHLPSSAASQCSSAPLFLEPHSPKPLGSPSHRHCQRCLALQEVWANAKKNVVAADAITPYRRDHLLATAELAGIPLNARMPADRTHSSGIVQGILGKYTEEELLAGVQSDVPVLAAKRQGTALVLRFAASTPPLSDGSCCPSLSAAPPAVSEVREL
ncbi:hypothetical protein HPB50_001511 [Hyalomma asiaticum]|uniref:Uncharacterized protein n=1 Tax=Hyalomma asiaticum TaxID=266040 RepID=A0ACB7TAT9_HYAAI|nr:hypothetical protein HPB50_001511 [Hyalomma asiaticum]